MGIDWSAMQGGSAEIFVMRERVVSKESKLRVEEVGKTFGEKNIVFGWKHFPSIKKWDSTHFRQTFGPDKWDLREGYGRPNLGEKGFQLFQLL